MTRGRWPDHHWTDPPPILSLADRIEPDERRRQRKSVVRAKPAEPPRPTAKTPPRVLTAEEIEAVRQRSAASLVRTPEQAIRERWIAKRKPVKGLDPNRIRTRA